MGNDIPCEHPYNIAKACNYGLNANVDTLITTVDIQHPTGISSVDTKQPRLRQEEDWLYVEADAEVSLLTLYAASGQPVAAATAHRVAVATLPKGIYIARVLFADGRTTHLSFVKK